MIFSFTSGGVELWFVISYSKSFISSLIFVNGLMFLNDSSSNMVVVNISSGIIRSVNVCLMDFICIFQHALIQISFDGSLEEILNRVAYCVVNFIIHGRYRFVPLSLTIHDTYNLLAMIYFNDIMKSVSRSFINISQWIAFVVINI